MEKLELKHITPYLPYGLNIKHRISKKELFLTGFKHSKSNELYCEVREKNSTEYKTIPIYNLKPILRPLSDLTKKHIDNMWFDVLGTDNEVFNYDEFTDNCELGSIELLPIVVLSYLLKNHFDIYGLIPYNLAIDINSIDKTY